MIKINLLPPKKTIFGPFQQEITLLVCILVLLLVLAGLVSAYERNKISDIKKSIGVLEKELVTLSEVAKNVSRLEKDKALLLQRMNVIKRIVVDRNIWPRFFDDLNQKLPEGIWFTNLTQNDGKTITINGFSFTNILLARFMLALETSFYIQKVDLDYAQKVVQSEEDTVKFQIIITLKQEM